jgi:Flp pilus assembly protein CpaB
VESILSRKVFATRRGTVVLGLVAAALAALALLAYLRHYRASVDAGAHPMSVLVARSLIQKGTPGDLIGSAQLYTVARLPRDQVKGGALADPKTLAGQAAASDIFPGQQLTADDFTTAGGNALVQGLSAAERAVVVPLDSPNEVGGQLNAGDHVDAYAAFNLENQNGISKPVVRLIQQDLLVLAIGSSGGNVTLRTNSTQAAELIFASQNAKLWLVLRPTLGRPARPPVVTADDLLTLPTLQTGGGQ